MIRKILIMLIIVFLSSCNDMGTGYDHRHCNPGCEETYIDSLDNHDYTIHYNGPDRPGRNK